MVTRVTKRDVIVALGLLSLPSLGQRNVETLVDRKALSNLLDPFLGTDGKRLLMWNSVFFNRETGNSTLHPDNILVETLV